MIYADANGSLPPLPEVREHLRRRLDSSLWANPNAIHSLGDKLKGGLEKCRALAADALGADPAHVIWTSGSSEGLSMVMASVLLPPKDRKNLVYVSAVEHAAMLNALAHYRDRWGYEVRTMPVGRDGALDPAWLEKELAANHARTALVTMMAANNETGVLQPWQRVRDLCRDRGILFLCDTTQWIGRMPFHFLDSGLDWAVVTGHKLGALPGSGILLARDPGGLSPLVWGGGQEQGLRGGTQNYLGAETLAIALTTIAKKLPEGPRHAQWRAGLEKELLRRFPSAVVVGGKLERLPGTTLLGYPGLHGQAVQIELEALDVFVTTSAACSDNEPATSKVLRAMGVDDALGRSVVRASFPLTAREEDYQALLGALTTAYEKLARIKAY